MKRIAFAFCAALVLLFGVSAPASAQVAWDAPLMVSPQMPGGFGIFLVDPAAGRLGVMGTWRGSATPGLGFRVGLAETRRRLGPDDDGSRLAGFGGVDFSGNLVRASDEFPLNVIWVTGAGLGVGSNVWVSFPLGVSLGRAFQADDVWFNPYIAPRVVLDALLGSNVDSDLDMDFAVDLGTDIAFQGNWTVRFGATLGDRNALAIGVAFPTTALSR